MHNLAFRAADVQPFGCVNRDVAREIEVPVPPGEVWQLVSDPDALGEWLDGEVELDVRPGGAGRFELPEGERRRGRVLEVEPGRRLAFMWWPVDDRGVGPASTVTITVEPAGEGSRVRVVERPAGRTLAAA